MRYCAFIWAPIPCTVSTHEPKSYILYRLDVCYKYYRILNNDYMHHRTILRGWTFFFTTTKFSLLMIYVPIYILRFAQITSRRGKIEFLHANLELFSQMFTSIKLEFRILGLTRLEEFNLSRYRVTFYK